MGDNSGKNTFVNIIKIIIAILNNCLKFLTQLHLVDLCMICNGIG